MPAGHVTRRRDQQHDLTQCLNGMATSLDGPSVSFLDGGLWDVEQPPPDTLRLDDVDAIVLLVSMAFPPGPLDQLLEQHPDLPVVVCAFDDDFAIGPDFSHASIAARGATVGTPMIASALTKRGRHFELTIVSASDTPSQHHLVEVSVAACAAGKLRASVVGRLGRPQGGYTHVDASAATVAGALGIEVRDYSPGAFAERYREAAHDEVAAEADSWAASLEPGASTEDAGYQATVRAAVGIKALVERERLDAGVMNCHVDAIRLGSEIGIAPCFALGCSTSAGVPWTCTGDTLTAVAMLLTQLLSHSSLYHELEMIDLDTGRLVVANTGEHDEAWLRAGEFTLQRNVWFDDIDERSGFVVRQSLAPGPATLVAVVPDGPSLKVVSAEGEVTEDAYPLVGAVNGAFRFTLSPAQETWTRWVRAGVTHHSALGRGHLGARLQIVCDYAGIRHEPVA